MITVDAAITAAQQSAGAYPTHAVTVQNNQLHFTAQGVAINALLQGMIPPKFLWSTLHDTGLVIYRRTDGSAYLTNFNPAVAAEWSFAAGAQKVIDDGTGGAGNYRSMRYGLQMVGDVPTILGCTHGASGITLHTGTIAANYTITWGAALTGLFGPPYCDTADKVCRVEACCLTTAGGSIIAVGTHDFTLDLTTIHFYWYTAAEGVVELSAVVQMPLSTDHVSWHADAMWASHIQAFYNSTTDRMVVTANSHPDGKPVLFTVQRGICSEIRPMIAVDPDFGGTRLEITGATKIEDTYFACGTFTTSENDVLTSVDVLLTSLNGEDWSFGERSFIIQQPTSRGNLLYHYSILTSRLYYGGSLYSSQALTTPELGDNTSSKEEIYSSKVVDLALTKAASGSDKLDLDIGNPYGTEDGDANLTGGSDVIVSLGWNAASVQMGVYNFDDPESGSKRDGVLPLSISGRDKGSKRLIDYGAPIDIEWVTRNNISTGLSTLKGLIQKTPTNTGLTLTETEGLKQTTLNCPWIAYADAYDQPDGVGKATVLFADTGETAHLSSFMFILAGDSDGVFTGVMIPKTGTWNAKAKPQVVKSNLLAYDKDARTGGFNFEENWQGLWDSNNYNASGTEEEKHLKSVLELADHYTYHPDFAATEGIAYDYAYKMNGRDLHVYAKVRDYSKAGAAAASFYTRILSYRFAADHRRISPTRNWPGLGMGTDVWADKEDVWKHSAFDQLEVSLTLAENYNRIGYDWNTLHPDPVQLHSDKTRMGDPGCLEVGQWVYTVFDGQGTCWRVLEINGAGYVQADREIADKLAWSYGVMYTRTTAIWGAASSGRVQANIGGTAVWVDPDTGKAYTPMYGYGAFVGNDTSQNIFTGRWIVSDGVGHYLLSGSPLDPAVGSGTGWDETSPLASPRDWKMLFYHHGLAYDDRPRNHGLPDSGYIRIEGKEIAGYAETSFRDATDPVSGGAKVTHWMWHIPTYYVIPANQTVPSAVVTNYTVDGNMVSQDLGDIPNAEGALVEFTNRNRHPALADHKVFRVQSVTHDGGGIGQMTMDSAPETTVASSEMIIISERQMFETTGGSHPSDAIITYYPTVKAKGKIPSFITLQRYDYQSGLDLHAERAIRKLAGIAGLRDLTFHNYMTAPYHKIPYPCNPGAGGVELPTVGPVSNFVMEWRAHIPGNSTDGAGATTSEKRLIIDFRSYYRLQIQQYTTAAEYQAGTMGNIRLMLGTTSADVDPLGLECGLLECVTIPVTAANIAGAVAAAHPAYTLTEDVAKKVDIVLIVRDNLVIVELAGQHLWTFNLDHYIHTDGTSYKKTTAGPITLYSTVAVVAGTVRVVELDQAQDRVSISRGNNAATPVNNILKRRMATSHATNTGGLVFSQWLQRDDIGAWDKNIDSYKWSSKDTEVTGHVVVTGKARGQYYDLTWIGAHGYKMAVVNGDADTPDNAAREAKLRVYKGIENSRQGTITGIGLLQVEPEDYISDFHFGGSGDTPQHITSQHIISTVKFKLKPGGIRATYTVRDYKAW